jgi:hypothetical protein
MAFAVKAAEDAQVVEPEKYGIPPEVPATVKAGVVVGLATEMSPPVKPTVVTLPPAQALTLKVPSLPEVCTQPLDVRLVILAMLSWALLGIESVQLPELVIGVEPVTVI